MAVTIERQTAPSSLSAKVEAAVFAAPLWIVAAATLTAATLLHGFRMSGAIGGVELVARDPFHQLNTTAPWLYQSPLGPMISWAIGATTAPGIAVVHYCITTIIVFAVPLLIARWHSDLAGRLWLFAYWCSPQSWASVAALGLFDIITVAGISVCVVAPTGACFAAGLLVGVNHFEQGLVAMIGVAVVRCVIRRRSHVPVVSAFAGLVLGKAIVMTYLSAAGIEANGRLDFIREHGAVAMIRDAVGNLLTLEWAVYNVLWIGVIWMLWTMRRTDRLTTIGLHVFLTLPVLVTFDLSRVYRTTTWPIVMLLVVYAAEWQDRRPIHRAAIVLALAAIFVPRTEIWHGGLHING